MQPTGFRRSMGMAMLTALFCLAPDSSALNTLTLSVGSAIDTVRKELFGALMENYGYDMYSGIYVGTASTVPNTNGMRNDIIQLVHEAGLNCLEFPGGCFAEQYNWLNGIGPKSSRPGGDMTNGMGTAEYFQLCELTNTIPYITADITATDTVSMANWLTYIDTISTNPEWKNLLKYWKMGNEYWGGCGTVHQASVYTARYNMYRRNIPAAWSGKLYRIADAGSGNNLVAGGPGNYHWLDTVLMNEVPGNNVDGLSYHYYALNVTDATDTVNGPSIGFTMQQYYARVRDAWYLKGYIDSCISHMNKYDPNRTTKLVVDEWGAWYTSISGMGSAYQQSTPRDAVIAGMTENIFINQASRIRMALVAQLVNVIESLFLTRTHSSATDSSLVKTPTFYVFQMYRPHQLAKMVPATLVCDSVERGLPSISAAATVDSTNALHISLVNTHIDSVKSLTVQISGAPNPYTSVSASIVTGPTDSSYNDYNKTENVNIQPFAASNYSLTGSALGVVLPAHSVVMFTLKPGTTGVLMPPQQGIPGLSMKSVPGCGIGLGYGGARNVPATVELLGIDGRSVASAHFVLGPGCRSIVWRPIGINPAGRMYIVNITVDSKMLSRRMMFVR